VEQWSCIDLMGEIGEMISDASLADLFTIVIKVCTPEQFGFYKHALLWL
jgi:hypothetical protein